MSFVKDTFNAFTGETGAEAATGSAKVQSQSIDKAIAETQRASEQGLAFLDPFSKLGESGLAQAGFLTDPQAQFDFLQNNPLFQLSLDNANTQTNQSAASRGRLSAGDTLQQLSNNVLTSASPLIAQQKQSIGDLLNIGTGIAQSQANTAIGTGSNVSNLITDQGAVKGAGIVGSANAKAQGAQNIANLGLTAGIAASDKRLKEDITLIGFLKGFNIYSWRWNDLAKTLGLSGRSYGVIAQEVVQTRPDAVVDDGYLKVNYELLGVPHGN